MSEKTEYPSESTDALGPLSWVLGLGISIISAATKHVFWMLLILGTIISFMNLNLKTEKKILETNLIILLVLTASSQIMAAFPNPSTPLLEIKQYLDPLLTNVFLFSLPCILILFTRRLLSKHDGC